MTEARAVWNGWRFEVPTSAASGANPEPVDEKTRAYVNGWNDAWTRGYEQGRTDQREGQPAPPRPPRSPWHPDDDPWVQHLRKREMEDQ